MQELLDLCPCESEYHFDMEENLDWIKLAKSPSCNYPKLCEKMLSILNNLTFLRIQKEVAVNVFDGKYDQVLTGSVSLYLASKLCRPANFQVSVTPIPR